MKKAFSLLELIIIIVVVGIISAAFLSKDGRDPLAEAALQVASHIRYTQHLAMMDDKYSLTDNQWYKGRWQIVFGSNVGSDNKPAYTIFADKNGYSGDPSTTEIAKNPANPKQLMTGGYTGSPYLDITNSNFLGMKTLNLGKTYGVTSYELKDGCSGARISFDHLGRPLKGDNSTLSGPYKAGTRRLIKDDCHIVLGNGSKTITITVKPETGYVKVEF